MRTTLSDCTVQPASRRPGSTRLLRLFGGGLLVLGLGVVGSGCGNDLATDEAAIAHEVTTMIEQGPSAVQEIYVYDVDASGEMSTDPAGVDPSTGTTTDPAGGDPSTGTGGCTPKPPTPPMPPMPPPTPMCTKEKQGGATSCKDEKTWRSYGEAYCKMKGLVLKNTTFDTSCGRGEWRYATYECCKASPPPPPPPPPPGPRCTDNKAGDGRTCKDRAAWKAEGAKFCASKMAILTVLTLEDRCGTTGDNWKTAHFECCGWTPPPPPPPPPPMMCVTAGAGGPGVCKSQADWKAEADKACMAHRMTLKNVIYGAACRRPDGTPGNSEIKYECCPTTPPPPPPPPMCITQSVSDPSVCKSEADWKTAGEAFCKSKMLTLKSVKVGAACMGPMTRGFSGATFECCPGTPPPPPPPPMCTKYTDGGTTTTCKSDGDWKMAGERYCASKMLTLKNITFGMACALMGARGFNSATYECCPGTPPPPPPPPTCTTDLVGGAGVCRSEMDWKTAAEAFCKMKGSMLKNISFGAACSSGMTRGYSEAKIECCK